jgi:hypothetical protein
MICRYRPPPDTIYIYRRERQEVIYIFNRPYNPLHLLGLAIIVMYALSFWWRIHTMKSNRSHEEL